MYNIKSFISRKNNTKYDFYATESKAISELLKKETFNKNIWEICCGNGILSKELIKHGYNVKSSDIIKRGYGEVIDFLSVDDNYFWDGDIITNPPYKNSLKFIEKSLKIIRKNNKACFLLPITFLESQKRYNFFQKHPIYIIYVSVKRINCALNADFKKYNSSFRCLAWFIWKKGHKGKTIIKYFNH
ncbi:MAG: DNA N-6-adenine-methyltransferase [Candidatus Woesearchaeota archaeon]